MPKGGPGENAVGEENAVRPMIALIKRGHAVWALLAALLIGGCGFGAVGEKLSGPPVRYTGLIVRTSDPKFKPSLLPRLIEEKSNAVLYEPAMVQRGILIKRGVVAFAERLNARNVKKRVGRTPLILKGVGTKNQTGDLILSEKDAKWLRDAEERGKFLSRAAVAIVIESSPAQ